VKQRGMRTNCRGLNRPCGSLWPAPEPHRPPFTFDHEEYKALLNRCFKRICGWRVPPNWSIADWREEIRAHGLAAVYQAIRDFDASRRVPLDAFVYQRVIARAYSRFRQEWAYGLHCISPTDGVFSDGGHVSGESCVQYREFSVEPDPAYQALLDTLGSLSEPNHRLITQLFWEGKTEVNIADILGISHQAVSKRKRAVIQKLRAWLQIPKKTKNILGKVAKSMPRCISEPVREEKRIGRPIPTNH
jgi:DNA-directed RNA polymerase specialized sigma24 family protein